MHFLRASTGQGLSYQQVIRGVYSARKAVTVKTMKKILMLDTQTRTRTYISHDVSHSKHSSPTSPPTHPHSHPPTLPTTHTPRLPPTHTRIPTYTYPNPPTHTPTLLSTYLPIVSPLPYKLSYPPSPYHTHTPLTHIPHTNTPHTHTHRQTILTTTHGATRHQFWQDSTTHVF